jgi:hypothetical protein
VATATTVVHQEVFEVRVRDWAYLPVACFAAAVLAYVVIPRAQMLSLRPKFNLSVRQEGAQIRITWNRFAAWKGANLEIVDGSQHMAMFVPGRLSNLTYQARTADVEVRFGSLNNAGSSEIARCLVREPESVAILDNELAKTTAEAALLRGAMAQRTRRVDRLQRIANRLLARMPPPRPKPITTVWWR